MVRKCERLQNFVKKGTFLSFLFNSLPDWAEEAIQPNSTMEYIAKLLIKSNADTPELARLKSGFLIKEIMERFNQKISSTIQPDRSLWLYSAHDLTIANVLNAFGLFEVFEIVIN